MRRDGTENNRRQSVAFGLKISTSGALYILITLLIGFAAVNTGNNLLFLIVAGLLAFMSVTGFAGMYNIKKMIPNLHPPDEIYAGIPAPFRLSVKNSASSHPSFLIRVECHNCQALVFPVVRHDAVCSDTVLLTFSTRGQVPSCKVTVSSPYPVGFFTRYWIYEIHNPVTVFPHPIATDARIGSEDSQSVGTSLLRERGLSGELERIYPYSGSEPLRMIHWKLTARNQEYLVKGFGRSAAAPMWIVLDELPGKEVEERLSRAAWLVRHWVSERPVGLQLGNRILQTGCGRQYGLKLLKELALYGID